MVEWKKFLLVFVFIVLVLFLIILMDTFMSNRQHPGVKEGNIGMFLLVFPIIMFVLLMMLVIIGILSKNYFFTFFEMKREPSRKLKKYEVAKRGNLKMFVTALLLTVVGFSIMCVYSFYNSENAVKGIIIDSFVRLFLIYFSIWVLLYLLSFKFDDKRRDGLRFWIVSFFTASIISLISGLLANIIISNVFHI